MAVKTSPPLSEARNTITQIICSIQDYPENDMVIFLNIILQSTLQAIAKFGAKLPEELQWCKNLQTIALPPTAPLIDHSAPDNATQEPHNVTKGHSTDTTQEHSAIRGTTQEPSTVEDITQEDSTTNDTTQEYSAVENTTEKPPAVISLPDIRSIPSPLRGYIEKFQTQSESFPDWIANPGKFWESTETLSLTDITVRSFFRHSIVRQGKADIPTFQLRFNSIIAFQIFSRFEREITASKGNIKRFLSRIGETYDKIELYRNLIFGGRRRQEFCQSLTPENSETDYSPLFLTIQDQTWESGESYWRTKFNNYIADLKRYNFIEFSRQCKAGEVAQAVISFRQRCVDYKIGEPAEALNESNTTTSSECARTDLDGTRPPKRARTDVDLDVDCTRASKRSFTGPSATASETSIVVSGLNTLQLNNGGELSHGFQNVASRAQGGGGNWQAQGDGEWQAQGGGEWQAQGDGEWQGSYSHYDVDASCYGVDHRFQFQTTDILFDGLGGFNLAAAIAEVSRPTPSLDSA